MDVVVRGKPVFLASRSDRFEVQSHGAAPTGFECEFGRGRLEEHPVIGFQAVGFLLIGSRTGQVK